VGGLFGSRGHADGWMSRCRDTRRNRRQAAWSVALGALMLLVSACRPAGAGPSGTTSQSLSSAEPTAVASHVGTVDCTALASESPTEAAAALEAAGYQVFWRHVHTAPDGTTYNDVVSQPPSGVTADIALDRARGDAYVFVADPTDPAAHARGSPHC
jgi:hypothetical protein